MNTGRKRRHDYAVSTESTPYLKSTTSWSTSFSPRTNSPAPLANSRYELAGGLDTPIATAQTVDLWHQDTPESSDQDFRGRPFTQPYNLHESDVLPIALARESNGRPRAQTEMSSTSSNTWGIFSTLTGAAGRVWDFCRTGTVFRGFFAGGGTGYTFETPKTRRYENRMASENAWEDEDASPQTPMPGDYPRPSVSELEVEAPEYFSGRASKKSKKSHGDEGSLSNSWIMVNESPSRRKVPTASTASPAPMRRQTSRPTMRRTTTPAPLASPRPASAAGLRSPISPHKRTHSRTTSFDSHPTPHSTRHSMQPDAPKPESPLAKETAKHLQQIRRREKKEDRELAQFNKRLQDMIREGKEALGSKVEIEMEEDDEIW